MLSSDERNELRGLLDALCEETITPEQTRRLEEIVLRSPEAEAFYVQYVSQYADLIRHFAALAAPAADAPKAKKARRPVRRRAWVVLAGAVGLLGAAAAVLFAFYHQQPNTVTIRPGDVEAVDDSVAVLLRVHGAVWEDSEVPTRPGAALPRGWLHLKSGVAHLEFYSGATVILEGPADFRLISRTEAYCLRGKLRATVPPQAQGFTIGSPKLNLVDRGTEFGLQVGDKDATEVHVFQGKVELYDAPGRAAPSKELTTGKGVRLNGPDGLSPIPTDPAAFQTAEGLATLSRAETRRRQEQWLKDRDSVRCDPDLAVYYAFQSPRQTWTRTLTNLAPNGQPAQDGAIVGCEWATGRWPGKQGLEFKRVSDRVRFHVPDESKFKSLTMTAWVRVDALPNINNSLMMADGWEPGGPHWQIGSDGTLILGVQSSPKGKGAHYHAEGAITPNMFGQWLHLAVVYDGEARRVTHFVDGKAVAEVPTLFDIPIHIGDAELGNWNIASHRNNSPVRFLTGCMDEFMMFSRPLNADEVARLYAQGRPPN
jgi:hypothetical protein